MTGLPGDSSSLHSLIETPRCRMRIITIITANNNGLVGRSRSSCSDGRRSVEPRYKLPAHYLEGPWNERVPPHHGAWSRARCRSTRHRLVRLFLHPQSTVNRCHDQTVVSSFSIASKNDSRSPSILSGTNFGEHVPTTCFSINRYTRDNFRRLNRRVSESFSRQGSIIFSVCFLLLFPPSFFCSSSFFSNSSRSERSWTSSFSTIPTRAAGDETWQSLRPFGSRQFCWKFCRKKR